MFFPAADDGIFFFPIIIDNLLVGEFSHRADVDLASGGVMRTGSTGCKQTLYSTSPCSVMENYRADSWLGCHHVLISK